MTFLFEFSKFFLYLTRTCMAISFETIWENLVSLYKDGTLRPAMCDEKEDLIGCDCHRLLLSDLLRWSRVDLDRVQGHVKFPCYNNCYNSVDSGSTTCIDEHLGRMDRVGLYTFHQLYLAPILIWIIHHGGKTHSSWLATSAHGHGTFESRTYFLTTLTSWRYAFKARHSSLQVRTISSSKISYPEW